MTRRSFAALVPGLLLSAPPTDTALVKDFVGQAHRRNIEPIKELLAREPSLIYASYDWGGGDWENAIQAAAHTGGREMALYLLERGARLDLFAAAMLGYVEVLKSAANSPGFIAARGAHGIPLLSHAVAGKARGAVDFLLVSGADVNARHNNGMTALMIAVQTGDRDSVQLLLSKGADPNAKANDGRSVLGISLKANQTQIAGDLRSSGATE